MGCVGEGGGSLKSLKYPVLEVHAVCACQYTCSLLLEPGILVGSEKIDKNGIETSKIFACGELQKPLKQHVLAGQDGGLSQSVA